MDSNNTEQNQSIIVNFNYNIAKENGMFDNENNPIMYIIINGDIKMDNTKIIKHCCHVVSKVVRDNEVCAQKSETYLSWVNNFEPKDILKANEESLLYFINKFSDKTKEIWCDHIIDIDEMENSPFSVTAIAFTPVLIKNTPHIIKYLKNV